MRRIVSPLLAIVGITVLAAAADADVSKITWFLANVTPFASGQTASGFFTVDQESGRVVDWNITVTGGSKPALTDLKFVTNVIGCVAFCAGIFGGEAPGSITGHTVIQFRTPLSPVSTIDSLTLGISALRSEVFFPTSPQLVLRTGDMLDGTNVSKELFSPTNNVLSLIDRDGLLNSTARLVTFAGAPGKPNCLGQSVSTLAQQFRDLNGAAAALGFAHVPALQSAISTFCGR
jgi:hypothetical protein